MVLKKLIITQCILGECGSLEKLILTHSTLGGCSGLERTDFNSFYFERVWQF